MNRRTLVGAAWSVPVITVATAAPAFAGSRDAWTINSTSFEGTNAGTRNDGGTYQFRFTFTVPVGTTVKGPKAVFTFATAAGGDGTTVADVSTATGFNPRTVNGASCLGLSAVGNNPTNRFSTFQFTYVSELPGPTTGTMPMVYSYDFEMTGVSAADATGATVTFSATNSTIHPNISFRILAANNASGVVTVRI